MPSTVTVTGKTGPGLTMTAQPFTGVTSFTIDTDKEVLHITGPGGVVTDVDIAAATTITCTVSGNTYVLTIS